MRAKEAAQEAEELMEIADAIQQATLKHNAFLKELGLPALP
jgi:hypothetical protein